MLLLIVQEHPTDHSLGRPAVVEIAEPLPETAARGRGVFVLISTTLEYLHETLEVGRHRPRRLGRQVEVDPPQLADGDSTSS